MGRRPSERQLRALREHAIRPGQKLNPEGKNQFTGQRAAFEEAISTLLAGEVTPTELAALGIPPGALAMLPPQATRGEAIAVVFLSKALMGDERPLLALLERLWPVPRAQDPDQDGAGPETILDLMKLAAERKQEALTIRCPEPGESEVQPPLGLKAAEAAGLSDAEGQT